MLLNGGTGLDNMSAGAGADFLNGGDDNDTLTGGPGGDRIVGDRGGDTMIGGPGDDTTVWNNGDGSDKMDGEAGLDEVEVNGAAGAGDAFEIAPNGQRVKFDRVNLVPFTLDIATAETFEINGLGGDDTLLVKPGVPMAVQADGGDGNDSLTGAEEQDTFFGGVGDDTLNGGGGNDLLDGQEGDDTLLARDGVGDLVRGGAGTDSAKVDKADIVVDVEKVDRKKHGYKVDVDQPQGRGQVRPQQEALLRLRQGRGPEGHQGLADPGHEEVLRRGRLQVPPRARQGEVRPRRGRREADQGLPRQGLQVLLQEGQDRRHRARPTARTAGGRARSSR